MSLHACMHAGVHNRLICAGWDLEYLEYKRCPFEAFQCWGLTYFLHIAHLCLWKVTLEQLVLHIHLLFLFFLFFFTAVWASNSLPAWSVLLLDWKGHIQCVHSSCCQNIKVCQPQWDEHQSISTFARRYFQMRKMWAREATIWKHFGFLEEFRSTDCRVQF